jgi:hypothetical protein
MAYLYMNVAIHAGLVEHALLSFRKMKPLFKEKISQGQEIRICVLGGGPGSELLGVVRFIEGLKLPLPAYLDIVLVDRIKEWDETWHALKQGIDRQLFKEYGPNRSKWPAVISRSFLPLDITSVADFQNFATRFNGVDLFIFCYLVSELWEYVPKFEETLNLLISRASPDAFLLFIDRDQKHIRDANEKLVKSNPALAMADIKRERPKLDGDVRDLGEWYINIPSLPRQQSQTYFLLARKVA